MTHVYFVRHAESDIDVHEDEIRPLTPKGLRDRALVTEYLTRKNVSIVLSSPYRRASDTVAEYANNQNIKILYDKDFRERSIGSWVSDFSTYAQQQWSDFSYKLEGGESLEEVQSRNIQALYRVLSLYPDKSIAIGTHGTALSTVLNFFNPSFNYSSFLEIVDIMPWIVHFTFDKEQCIAIELIDLFQQ